MRCPAPVWVMEALLRAEERVTDYTPVTVKIDGLLMTVPRWAADKLYAQGIIDE